MLEDLKDMVGTFKHILLLKNSKLKKSTNVKKILSQEIRNKLNIKKTYIEFKNKLIIKVLFL